MFGPFSVWSPEFRFPLSGDVQQDIEPTIGVRGVPEIEHRVQHEVASYGKQLGKVLDALQTLAEATKVKLEDIDTLVDQVDTIKAECKDALREQAQEALRKLEQADPKGFQAVIDGLDARSH